MRTFFLLFCSLIFTVSLRAQKVEIEHFMQFGTLKNFAVYHGFLWIQREGGFLQCDLSGKILKKYDLPNGGISAADELWEGDGGEPFIYSKSKKALLRWDTQKQVWSIFCQNNPQKREQQFHHIKQQIWQVDKDSLRLWRNAKWQSYPFPKYLSYDWSPYGYIIFLEQSDKGDIFFRFSATGNTNFPMLYRWNGKDWSMTARPDEDCYSCLFLHRDTLYQLAKKRSINDAGEWQATHKKDSYWDGTRWQETQKWAAMPHFSEVDKYYCPRGGYLLCHYADTLWRIQDGSREFVRIPTSKEVSHIFSMYIEPSGRIWFGDIYDVFKETNAAFEPVELSEKSPNSLWGGLFFEQSGKVWRYAYRGAHFYENGKWTYLPEGCPTTKKDEFVSDFRQLVQTPDGNLYASSFYGVHQRLSDEKWKTLIEGDNLFMYPNAKGNLCVLYKKGLHYEIVMSGSFFSPVFRTLEALRGLDLRSCLAECESLYNAFSNGYAIMKHKIDALKYVNYSPDYAQSPAVGEVWLIDESAKMVYQYKDEKITEHRIPKKEEFQEYYFSVQRLKDSMTVLQVNTEAFYSLEKGKEDWEGFYLAKSLNIAKKSCVDKEGNFWFLDGEFGKEEIWQFMPKEGGMQSAAAWGGTGKYIQDFIVDGKGRIWTFREDSVRVFDSTVGTLIVTAELPNRLQIADVFESPTGEIWAESVSSKTMYRLRLGE